MSAQVGVPYRAHSGLWTPLSGDSLDASPPPPAGVQFGAEWWWGQDQGGPGGSTDSGLLVAPSTEWLDNFTTDIPAGGPLSVSNADNLWGTILTGSPALFGTAAMPAGTTGNVASLEVTSAQVANIPNTGFGAVMAKLFAAWGTFSGGAYHKPSDVSGTYGSYYYFPEDFSVAAGTDGNEWINLQQFKQTQSNGQNDPQWWVQVNSYQWAKASQGSATWMTAKPTRDDAPVMFLNCEGGPLVPNLYAVPLGEWFHLEAAVTQGTSIVWTVDGGAFATATQAHLPIGPDSTHPAQWIFGIGNYATFAGKLFACYSTYTP